jgi:AcrR family transcriptional regulator
LAATNALLETTPWSQLTVEAIALKAKVSKQTIYKWWGGKPALVMEAALQTLEEHVPSVSTGRSAQDLFTFLKRSSRHLRKTTAGRTMSVLIAEAQHDPAFARTFRDRFLATRRETVRVMLERGIADKTLRADLDLELLLDVIYGSFWYRLLTSSAPLDDQFIDQLSALLMPSIAVSAHRAGRKG